MHKLHNCGILELAKQVKLMNYQYKFFRFVSSHKTYTDFLCRGYKKTFSKKVERFRSANSVSLLRRLRSVIKILWRNK